MEVFYVLFGIFVGFLSGFFGIGGGTIIVPVMLLLSFSLKEAVGIAILPMLMSSVFGSLVNLKNKMFEAKGALFLGFGGFIGALSSGFIINYLDEKILLGVLIAIQILNILKMSKISLESKKAPIESMPLLFFLGLLVGIISISVGIGGAILILPVLVVFFRYDLKKAVSTGLFFVVFSSAAGFLSFAHNDIINYKVGLLVGLGALGGVFFGVRLAKKINKKLQRILLVALSIAILFVLSEKFISYLLAN